MVGKKEIQIVLGPGKAGKGETWERGPPPLGLGSSHCSRQGFEKKILSYLFLGNTLGDLDSFGVEMGPPNFYFSKSFPGFSSRWWVELKPLPSFSSFPSAVEITVKKGPRCITHNRKANRKIAKGLQQAI